MLPPLMVTVAGKVGGALVAGLTPRVKALLVGTDDQRALDNAIRRATNAAFEGFGGEVVDLTPERYFGDQRLSAVLIDSAFAGNDPDPVRIAAILVELGHDATTSPVDLVQLALDIGVQLQAQIRRVADTSGGALFNRLVLAKLDGLAARSVASNAAPRRVIALPPLPALVVGREPDFTAIRDRVSRSTQAAAMGATVVRGWPGVGKSTLAASVAHAALDWDEFPDGVLWTALGEAGDARTALVSWLRQLGTPATANSVDELSTVLGGLLRAPDPAGRR